MDRLRLEKKHFVERTPLMGDESPSTKLGVAGKLDNKYRCNETLRKTHSDTDGLSSPQLVLDAGPRPASSHPSLSLRGTDPIARGVNKP